MQKEIETLEERIGTQEQYFFQRTPFLLKIYVSTTIMSLCTVMHCIFFDKFMDNKLQSV